jgi:hypothetical protein
MTSEQIWSLVRTLLQMGGSALVARGLLDDGSMQVIVGALMAIITTLYSVYIRRPAGLVATTAALPDVKTVVVATNDLALKVGGGLPVKVG